MSDSKYQASLSYSSYLKVNELLDLQKPVSEGPEHDEMLFIVIHQTYELWFKQLIHEFKQAMKLLDAKGVKHDMVMLVGNASQEIVAHGQKGKYDMIVLGSKGRSAIADMVLGSVAQRVLTQAKQPVVLVK
jgi:nucleotide-binding universal stress UspA family protein